MIAISLKFQKVKQPKKKRPFNKIERFLFKMKINFKGKMSKNLKMNFKVVHKKVKTLKDDFECYQLIMFLAFFFVLFSS